MAAFVVNAGYAPDANFIGWIKKIFLFAVFPVSFLQPPICAGGGPKSLNYSGVGWIMGHEVTHAFDDQGEAVSFSHGFRIAT